MQGASTSHPSTSASDLDEWLGPIGKIPPAEVIPLNYSRQRRASVSAEPPGRNRADINVFPKSNEEMMRLVQLIKSIAPDYFLFRNLDDERILDIAKAVESVECEISDVIIEQGEIGDYFYIIETGEVDVFKKKDNNANEHIQTMRPPAAFGELALLHAAPRAATCIAKTKVKLWRLARIDFQTILVSVNVEIHAKREQTLRRIARFRLLGDYEIMRLAEALQPKTFQALETIACSSDHIARNLFIVEQGVVKLLGSGDDATLLAQGEHFGPFDNAQNIITATAYTDCTILFLGHKAVRRLIGEELVDLLKPSDDL